MKNKKTTIEFDIIGSKYDDMVKKALSIESSHEYFESYKVMHLKNIMVRMITRIIHLKLQIRLYVLVSM